MNINRLVLVIPVYNDWVSLATLLREVERVLAEGESTAFVVVVDDGSNLTDETLRGTVKELKHIQHIEVLRLVRNLGHQKAIALGLAYVEEKIPHDQVLVMDSDGEDKPEDILRLLEENKEHPDAVIFARRIRRSEGFWFRFFYVFYKFGFRLLTGADISFGNFSLVPKQILARLVYLPEIWNHYAAGIIRAKFPLRTIPTSRGIRYDGRSQMNFVALLLHGMSAMSIFIDVLSVRLVLISLGVIVLDILGSIALVFIKYFTPMAIPGWATTVAIGLVVIMFQAVGFLIILLFFVLNYRTTKYFIPKKDYKDFLFNAERIL